MPRGGEISGVTPEGNRMPGADGQGWIGDRNSPATQDTEGSIKNSHREKMASGWEPAVPQSPQPGTAEGGRGVVRLRMNHNGATGVRPIKNSRGEEIASGQKASGGAEPTAGHGRGRERSGETTHASQWRGGVPPTQQRVITARSQGIEGDTLTSQRAPPLCSQGMVEEGG